MIKPGRKAKEWQKAKKKLIQEYQRYGITYCERRLADGSICGSTYILSFHHLDKRSSGKAKHTFKDTRLLCCHCHEICEYDKSENDKLRRIR